MSVFILEFNGDLPINRPECRNPYAFYNLRDALLKVKEMFVKVEIDAHGPLYDLSTLPDPEDDRIVVYEANPDTNEVKAVWAFCGWHWNISELGLEKETLLPGMEKTLYELAMEN